MARPKKAPGEKPISNEYQPPDIERALKIYRSDIAPAKTKSAAEMQRIGEAYKVITKECHVPKKILDFVKYLRDQEDYKQEHELRCLHGLLQAEHLHMPNDLVDQAEGKPARENVVPFRAPPVSDGIDADLVDAATEVPGVNPDSYDEGDELPAGDGTGEPLPPADDSGEIREAAGAEEFFDPAGEDAPADHPQADYVQETKPTAPLFNQTWFNPKDGRLRYWHGSGWRLSAPKVDAAQ